MPFWSLCHESEAILLKIVSSRSPGLECAYEKNFHPGRRDLDRKSRDLGNQAIPASYMNTSIFLQRRVEISETDPVQSTVLLDKLKWTRNTCSKITEIKRALSLGVTFVILRYQR